ncbi:phage holin family protein [Leadbetterella byssophila]|uniref:phage holin family protein n=1 Tax=Leadbetterella byssophila TaxID=316068 RepID=UPI0039A1E58A
MPFLVFIVALYLLVLVLCGIDLWAGIQKAKLRGEFRNSQGLRRTVYKLSRYFNFLLAATVIDFIQMLTVYYFSGYYNLVMFPFFTSILALFAGVVEGISIYEKAEEKERREMEKAAKLAGEILANQSFREVLGNLTNYLGERRIDTEAPEQ